MGRDRPNPIYGGFEQRVATTSPSYRLPRAGGKSFADEPKEADSN